MKALPTIQKIELINEKKRTKARLDKNIGIFLLYIVSLISKITIYPACKAEIAFLLLKNLLFWRNTLIFLMYFQRNWPKYCQNKLVSISIISN